MKKLFFYAAAAVGMLSACSSSDDFASGDATDNESREAIKIGVASVASEVQTRGTGTVGGVMDGETVISPNAWSGQSVNVFMFRKGTLKLATSDGTDNPTEALYKDAIMTTPDGETTGEATLPQSEYKYYPPSGSFDFYGYRLDDAGTNSPAALNTEETAYTVDFTIDGTQDIMRATTLLSDADRNIIESESNTVKAEDVYSAKAARHGIQPNLLFNHLLSRFTFQIKGGNENSCPKDENNTDETAVKVESIKLSSRTNGVLTIAHLPANAPENDEYITWSKNETESETVKGITTEDGEFLPYLTLRNRTATKKVEVEESEAKESGVLKDGYEEENGKYYKKVEDANVSLPTEAATGIPNMWIDGASAAKNIGEALLVSPGLDKYTLEITVKQKILKNPIADGSEATDDDYRFKTKVYTLDITPDLVKKGEATGIAAFEAGKSYNVIITIYGFERIVVTTTLAPWEDGGEINIGQD